MSHRISPRPNHMVSRFDELNQKVKAASQETKEAAKRLCVAVIRSNGQIPAAFTHCPVPPKR